MILVDTNVIVVASTPSDSRHEACLNVLAKADSRGGACASHSLAEVFSIMTGRPAPLRVPPGDAARLVAYTSKRFKVISLTAIEYVATIESLATLGYSGGMIYDALLLACARKSKATQIYTLNQRHFRAVAPDLASRIIEP
jgi:predicted nucleic acid-binding protein